MKGLRERKKLQARQTILNAAAQEFKSQGFLHTSISDIMHRSNLGVGTFYGYFGSKEEILMEIVKNLFTEVEEKISARQADESSIKLLESCCMATAKLIDENRFILPLFTSAGIHSDKPESMPNNLSPEFKKIFKEILFRGQQRGEIRQDIPIDLILEMFHSIYQAAAFSKLKIPFTENVRLKIKILLDGISERRV